MISLNPERPIGRRSGVAFTSAAALIVALAGCASSSRERVAASPSVLPAPTATPTAAAPKPTSAATPTARAIEVRIAGGRVSPAFHREPVRLGETVTLLVTSDSADEVHVHGYDLKSDIAAGGTATVSVRADLSGTFEVELERHGLQLLELAVS